MSQVALSAEQIRAAVERRQAAILEKWLAGKASPAEQAEIAPIIAQITGPPESAEPPPAAPAEDPSPFQLETPAAPPGKQRRTGLIHPLAVYAERYATDLRTIKRWIADGRDARPEADPCPLDDPAAVPGWWTRRKHQRVPDNVLAAARAAVVQLPTPGANSPDGNPVPTQKISSVPATHAISTQPAFAHTDLSSIVGATLSAQVMSFRRTVSINAELLNRALLSESPDETVITTRQRNYERSLEQLRKLETTERESRIASDELVTKADVQADLGALLASLATMRGYMAEKIADELPFLNGEQRRLLIAAVERVRAREDDLLRTAGKWQPAEVAALLATAG